MEEINLTDATFDKEVLESEKPVLVDFWAPWCGPCKMVSPAVAQIAEDLKDHLKVAKINVDENPISVSKYNVFSIPALKIYMNGKIIGEIVGAAPKPVIEDKVKSFLGLK